MSTREKKNLLSKDLVEIWGSNFGLIDMKLFQSKFDNKSLKTGSRYSKDIKEFTISIHFYISSSGGSSASQNKLPQLILGYIYILKYVQSNFIG